MRGELELKLTFEEADDLLLDTERLSLLTALYQIDQNYRENYGLSLHQVEQRIEDRNGLCDICKRPSIGQRLSVDHNHSTGQVRGMLCIGCNVRVGRIESLLLVGIASDPHPVADLRCCINDRELEKPWSDDVIEYLEKWESAASNRACCAWTETIFDHIEEDLFEYCVI